MLPGTLAAVDLHYREMRRLDTIAILLVRKAWNTLDRDDVVAAWNAALPQVFAAFTSVQRLAAVEGAGYGGRALREQGLRDAPDGAVIPEALVGFASDGRTLDSLLRTPVGVMANRLDSGATFVDSLESGRASLERIAHTQIADTARAAAGVDIASRPGVGWVRMLNPPSCSRCTVLAGRVYRWNAGFDRHPRCDCVHVATSAAAARREGLVDDPKTYFNSLSKKEQDRIFTKDGAQAIRDGADVGQVVNARRGMSTVARDQFGNRRGRLAATKVFGQDVFTTLEGTTTRGLAGKRLIAEGGRLSGQSAETVRRISRDGTVERTVTRQRVQIPRLMPESIYALAKDRADAIRLLRRFGYIR